MTTFWLGTHKPIWLERTDVPLFVSHRALHGRATLPEARGPWALDSGGFTELRDHGRWLTSPTVYADSIARFAAEIGQLKWAAPQDYMCEPFILAKTGLSVAEHQRRTIESVLRLRDLVDVVPVVPVLQGWVRDDYLRHADAYAAAGVPLEKEPLVGLGSVCRRQHFDEAGQLIRELAGAGLRLHGFGVKMTGLVKYAEALTSADSLAWSYNARRNPPLPGCRHAHCNNCILWALAWRERLLDRIPLRLEVFV